MLTQFLAGAAPRTRSIIHSSDPDRMTSADRVNEVASILAAGILRLRETRRRIDEPLQTAPKPVELGD